MPEDTYLALGFKDAASAAVPVPRKRQAARVRTTEIFSVLLSTLRLILSLDCPGMSALTCGGGRTRFSTMLTVRAEPRHGWGQAFGWWGARVGAKAVVWRPARLVVVRELRGSTPRYQLACIHAQASCTVTGDKTVRRVHAGGAVGERWTRLDQVDGDGARAAAAARVPAAAATAAADIAHVGGDRAPGGEAAEDIAEAAAEEGVAEERVTEQGERHDHL